MLLQLPIATTLAMISQGEIVYVINYQLLLYHDKCLFRPGDRLQPVCLMIMSYNCFIENFGGPWSSGAWGPGPNGPVVDPPLSNLVVLVAGLCPNALAFANASANAAFALALAFDSSVMDAFALAFLIHPYLLLDLHLIQMHLIESNAKQMRNKCESNATVLLLLHNGYSVSWFRLE